MGSEQVASSSSIFFNWALVLQILFLIFKVQGLVDWPWFYVLAPLIVKLTYEIAAFVVFALFTYVVAKSPRVIIKKTDSKESK